MTYIICWTCHLPIPTVASPVGEIADPQHNCIEALKTEVARLRRMVTIDRTDRQPAQLQMPAVPAKNLLPTYAIRNGGRIALQSRFRDTRD